MNNLKKMLVLVFIIFLSCAYNLLNRTIITKTYDEFEDRTTFKINYVNLAYKTNLHFYTANQGKYILPTQEITMHFARGGTDWKFLNYTKTVFLIDNKRYDLGSPEHHGSVSNGVFEQMFYDISISFIKKLAYAKSVKLKIGVYEYEINSDGISHIKEYYNRLPKFK